jgi:hypothetical protein
MVKDSLLVLLLAMATACGNAKDAPVPASSLQAESLLRLREVAAARIKVFPSYDKPRIVPRGAKPEIIVKGDQLFIEGKHVAIGQPLEIWKQAIRGAPRCDDTLNLSCDWDDLGLTLLTEGGVVKQIEVYFNLEPWGNFAERAPDGTPIPPTRDPRPKHPFPGYFEWDGYAIDKNTRFWEIRASVDPYRNVRCDLLTNNCGNTTARFNTNAKIYLELYQVTHENGKLASFSIGRIAMPNPAEVDP